MSYPPRIYSLSNRSIRPEALSIECAMFLQLPSFQIVGLPAPEVAEARERVRAAILASGHEFPRQRLILNLSPASYRKSGTGLDLPMALGVILSQADAPTVDDAISLIFAWGELALDGTLRGAGMVHRAHFAARLADADVIVFPEEDREESESILRIHRYRRKPGTSEPRVIYARSLAQAIEELAEPGADPSEDSVAVSQTCPVCPRPESPPALSPPPSLLNTLGALAAGEHHVLLIGPQGTGKTQALEWLIWLSPLARLEQQLESKMAEELIAPLGKLSEVDRERAGRIVRRVGSQVRAPALLGSFGNVHLRPGELALAHGGALVADEFAEWSRDSRELLREPLESGVVTLNRTRGSHRFDARFKLLAGSNLCPCGGCPKDLMPARKPADRSRIRECRCAEPRRKAYLDRIKGPVLDRIHAVVPVFAPLEPTSDAPESDPDSARVADSLAERVDRARELARSAWGSVPGLLPAADLELLLRSHRCWRETARRESGSQSLRGIHHTLRLALSLCAWDGLKEPRTEHWMAAGYLRPERLGM